MFSRKKPLEPVTPQDGERAKHLLQATTNFDIDQFLDEHTVEVLFNTPLGPTRYCLNVNQVAEASAGSLKGPAKHHLDTCASCGKQVHAYRALEETDFTETADEVDILGYVRVPAGKNLFLVLYNRGNDPVLSEIDPKSIEVSGAIDGKVRSVDKLDPRQYNAKEAVAVHFESFTLHVPESGESHDYVCFGATTRRGRFQKRRLVHLIDESKTQATEATSYTM